MWGSMLFAFAGMWASVVAQRVTSIGFGFLAVPCFTVLFGAEAAVVVALVMGSLVCGQLAWSMRQQINWRQYRYLAGGILLGTVPGTLIVARLDAAVLKAVIGTFLVLALALPWLFTQWRLTRSAATGTCAGFLAGVTGSVSGMPGPVLAAYAGASTWDQREFGATVQPVFVTVGISVLASRAVMTDGSLFPITLPMALVLLAAILVGVKTSPWVASKVPPLWAWRSTLGLALFGALGMIVMAAVTI